MTDILIGRFYLKKTSNGNLIGEFSNNKDKGIYTESADLIKGYGKYIGDYISTWQGNKEAVYAKLKISYRTGTSKKLYNLIWSTEKKKTIFKGEGMLCDNILIGDYQKA